MNRFKHTVSLVTLVLAITVLVNHRESFAQNNNVQIDMSVMQALNNYYDDEPDGNDNTQIIEAPAKPAKKPEKQASKPLPVDNKTKKIKQLLSFKQKELPKIVNVPLPSKKPQTVLANTQNVMGIAGATRKTEVTSQTDIQQNLPADDSGIAMPAVPAASIAAEVIQPSENLSQTDLAANPTANEMEAAEKNYMDKNNKLIDITAGAGDTENINMASIESMPPQVINPVQIPLSAQNSVSLPYQSGQNSISTEQQDIINDDVLTRLKSDDSSRLQIVSYASSTKPDISNARRISLARALALRSYLMSHGIESHRMDVRALGNQSNGSGVSDRIDLVFISAASKG